MKPFLPYMVAAVALASFVFYVWHTSSTLPERIVTSFDAKGAPTKWENRDEFRMTFIYGGLVTTAFFMGMSLLGDLFPRGIAIPDKDYWLSGKRRAATLAHFRWLEVKFNCLFLAFITFAFRSDVRPNSSLPPREMPGESIAPLLIFVGFIGLILHSMLRFSSRPAK